MTCQIGDIYTSHVPDGSDHQLDDDYQLDDESSASTVLT